MVATTDSFDERLTQARSQVDPLMMAMALGIVLALGFTLLFLQEPLAHESLHNFRHSIGITCH